MNHNNETNEGIDNTLYTLLAGYIILLLYHQIDLPYLFAIYKVEILSFLFTIFYFFFLFYMFIPRVFNTFITFKKFSYLFYIIFIKKDSRFIIFHF